MYVCTIMYVCPYFPFFCIESSCHQVIFLMCVNIFGNKSLSDLKKKKEVFIGSLFIYFSFFFLETKRVPLYTFVVINKYLNLTGERALDPSSYLPPGAQTNFSHLHNWQSQNGILRSIVLQKDTPV